MSLFLFIKADTLVSGSPNDVHVVGKNYREVQMFCSLPSKKNSL